MLQTSFPKKVDFLSVQKIFYVGLIIGTLTGVGVMYLFNGFLGHAHMKEAVLAFSVCGAIVTFTICMVFTRLKGIWNVLVGYPSEAVEVKKVVKSRL